MLLHVNGRTVDLQRGSVTLEGGHLVASLRPQAAEILQVLAGRCGQIVSKDELMQTVWGDIAVSDDSLVQCVIEIRKALGDDKHRIVRTLPKRGYVLETTIDDNRPPEVLLATPRRNVWIGPAVGLGAVVMAATAAYFWMSPGLRSSPVIAALSVDNRNGDPGALDAISARERAKVAEADVLAARREIDTLKNSVQTVRGAREETLRRELDSIRRSSYLTGVQVRAADGAKAALARAVDEQRQRADQLARDLALAQREVESAKAEAEQKRKAAATSSAQAKKALSEELEKVGLLERRLAAANQFIDALRESAKAGEVAQAMATQRQQTAEAALMRTGDALALERKKTETLTRELEITRLEREAAKDNVVRVSTAMDEALQQERERATGLARELIAARNQIDILAQPSARLSPASKVRGGKGVSLPATAPVLEARPIRQLVPQEIRKVAARNSTRPRISLPVSLLPVE